MAVKRQLNVLGQQRIDAPHLRMLESAVAADFDALAGGVLAGSRALVIRGFAIASSGMTGQPAANLQVVVGGGMLIHPLATEAGSVFTVADSAPNETLSTSNANVEGSFSAGYNYVGIDLRREADDSTADTVTFLDTVSWTENPRLVPLARILKYRFVISRTEFAATPHLCPLAVVNVTPSGGVTSISDARQMAYRLASGGSNANNLNAFIWPQGRSVEASTVDAAFTGGDRAIGSSKDWQDAVMTRLWELGGGERWFTANSDRDTKLCLGGTGLFPNGDNFRWTLGTSLIEWTSLYLVFANSTAVYNTITNGTATLADNQCLYVDVNRSTNAATLTMQVANLATLGAPAIPGSRFIIAWRRGNEVFFRDKQYEAGRTFVAAATNASLGTVQLSYAVAGTPTVAPRANTTGTISNTAIAASNGNGLEGTADGTGVGVQGTGGTGATAGVYGVTTSATGYGIQGLNNATTGTPVSVLGQAISAASGTGVRGVGTGNGVLGIGSSSGNGVRGEGGGSGGAGVIGVASGGNSDGVQGTGFGTGVGVRATAGTGAALLAVGGSGGGMRVQVSGTAVPAVDGSSEALQLRNTTVGTTNVAISMVHADAADPPDGWMIRTNRVADNDIDLRFSTMNDGGALTDRMQYDASADALILAGDSNAQITAAGAQIVRAQQLWLNSALSAESSKVIGGGGLFFNGATFSLSRGSFRFADGTVYSNSTTITAPISGMGFTGNGQRYIYLTTAGTLLGSTTAPNRNGHDGTTSRCYVGSVMVSSGSAANCRVVTTDFGVRYVTMANTTTGLNAFFGNAEIAAISLTSGASYNAYNVANNQAAATNLTINLPTARSLYYNLSLFLAPSAATAASTTTFNISCVDHGVAAIPIAIPSGSGSNWNRLSNGTTLTNNEVTSVVFSTQVKLMNYMASGVQFSISALTGWQCAFNGALAAYEENVNNPVNE
jgi:hypothetical protein